MNVDKLKPKILRILQSSDLDTITSKSVRKLLQQETSEPLDAYKKELNTLILQCLDIVSNPTTSQHATVINNHKPSKLHLSTSKKASSSSLVQTNHKKRVVNSDDENETRPQVKKKKRTKQTESTTLPTNPFTKPWLLSSTLREVTGERMLSRPGVVKALWKYIKANELQDPMNQQFIVCDDKLRRVFDGQDRMNCFAMNKLIGKHLMDLPADSGSTHV
ncbi:SWIB/MDM2 domain-containing protein [Chlamydoabsidia padenii]|nr:SWIB/MDM2 domain-containing protein [Chlamydoabsidia padenii]